jgi:2-oxoglutarate ferredoxin oxidoreductase subunit delta
MDLVAPSGRMLSMKYWRKPLDADTVKIKKGIIHIIKERCKGCGFCVEYCPKDVLETSEEYNDKGYHAPYVKHPDSCLECHLCELLCPEFAIFVIPEGEEEKKEAEKVESRS